MSATGLSLDAVDVTTTAGTAGTDTGSVDATATLNYATSKSFTVAVDGGTAQTVTLSGTYADSTAKLADINSQLTGATANYDSSKNLVITSDTLGTGSSVAVAGSDVGTEFGTETAVAGSGNSASGADLALAAIDTAIKTVSTTRADLGAVQNRFDHTINNLNVAVENLSASESRIRDTDMAAEMMEFTRAQILSQAGTAMLAQANQAPQGVLRLLQ
jgi:flagellin